MQNIDREILVNFCILPPESVAKQYESLSKSLESPYTLFVLGNGKFAHITIYMARFPAKTIDQLISKAASSLKNQKPFICRHTGYLLTDGNYLEASYRKSDEMLELHENLIATLRDLRLKPGKPRIESYFGPYTPEQQQNAQDTGYDLAYGLYRPHVTLTRYANNKALAAFPELPTAKLSFECQTIGMYEADENGAVFRKCAEFKI